MVFQVTTLENLMMLLSGSKWSCSLCIADINWNVNTNCWKRLGPYTFWKKPDHTYKSTVHIKTILCRHSNWIVSNLSQSTPHVSVKQRDCLQISNNSQAFFEGLVTEFNREISINSWRVMLLSSGQIFCQYKCHPTICYSVSQYNSSYFQNVQKCWTFNVIVFPCLNFRPKFWRNPKIQKLSPLFSSTILTLLRLTPNLDQFAWKY